MLRIVYLVGFLAIAVCGGSEQSGVESCLEWGWADAVGSALACAG